MKKDVLMNSMLETGEFIITIKLHRHLRLIIRNDKETDGALNILVNS